MAMNYRETSRRIEQEMPEFNLGAKIMAEMAQTLQNQGLLPKELPKTDRLSQASASQKEVTPIEVRRFSDEAKAALEKEGYVVDTLTSQSIATLRSAGKPFWSTWHKDYPQFEALTSMSSEVAIHPEKLFIPKSNNRTLAKQEDLINKFSQELGKKVPGVDAIMGGMADYVDLAFAHLEATGDRLFGEKYNYNYARTNTPTVGAGVAVVGNFGPSSGLSVSYWHRGVGASRVFAAPLVVPN